jgi:hypothetical protein
MIRVSKAKKHVMRKLCIAVIKNETFRSFDLKSVEQELYCLAYGDNVGYDNEVKGYYVMGKPQIKRFVESMRKIITESREVFKDPQSIKDFEADEKTLSDFLKIKAS